MSRKWTREERKQYLKEKYRHTREKMFFILAVAALFLILLSLLAWGISIRADPFLLIVLAVTILVLIPVSIFINDTLSHEV